MMKRITFVKSTLLLLLTAQCFLGFSQAVNDNSVKFSRLLRLVESYYVDSTSLTKLTEKAIISLLQELDPHSVYISKDEVEKMNEPLKGNFEGIGITFNIFRDTLLVTSTVPGGPSEKTGVMAGDRIVSINGTTVAGVGLTNNDVFEKLRGPKGTKVEIKIKRQNLKELLDFTIIRDKIPLNSLDASYMLNKETGYIKLNRFSATTVDEFHKALEELKKNKLKNLVLDLRNNGGGYLQSAIEIAEEFLPEKRMIVYTEGLNNPKKEYNASSKGNFEEGSLVILVNEGSASASEIVAGAIQDWDRGIIVGRRSFGKGLVQQPFYLTDGSMVRLTTAHYYTPSGRCIQKPYNTGIEDYRTEYQKRYENGEMFHPDSISFADSLKYKTLETGRTVYGGGGIMPDIFVPLDTSVMYSYFNRMQRNNIFYNYTIDHLDKNRNKLEKLYPDFRSFNSNFLVDEKIITEVIAAAEKEGIPREEKSISFTSPLISKEIKALIARDLFSVNYFYEVYNADDKTIEKALELLKNQQQFRELLINRVE